MPETKTGAPNIQDVFLNYARREKLAVVVHLLDGREFEARIKNFDRFALIVEHDGMDHLVFKHAIATIRTPRSVAELLLARIIPATPRRVPSARHRHRARQRRHRRAAGRRRVRRRGQQHARQHRRAGSAATFRRWPRSGSAARVPLRGVAVPPARRRPRTAAWREASPGKDSVTGHWELMGLVLDRPFPTFPHGFPPDDHRRVRAAHRPADRSATSSRRAPRSSTSSAPSTCAPAARSSTRRPTACSRSRRTRTWCRCRSSIEWCRGRLRDRRSRALGLGRVIARPFVGTPGAFKRTANRHDYAMPPTGETLLDRLAADGHPVIAIGKINDLFAGRGIGDGACRPTSDDDGMDAVEARIDDDGPRA